MSTASELTRSRSLSMVLRAHGDELCVALLTVGAVILRASQIDQSIVGDEVWTYQDIIHHSLGTVLTTVHTGGENSPPLYFVLAWLSAKLGDPTVWIRLPSIVFSAATVPVVYWIGRETLNRGAGVIAAGIMAVAPFPVFYGIEARPYATMTFFVACSIFAVLRAVRTGSWRWWAAYTFAAAAAAYSHYTCIFVLVVVAGWAIWRCRDRWYTPAAASAAVVLLYAPWLPHLRGKELAVIGGIYPLGTGRVLTDLLRPVPGHPSAPLRAIPTILGLAAVGVCVIGGLVAWVRRRRMAHPVKGRLGLLVLLTAATPVGLLLYSLLVTDLWLPRGLSASLPAAALLLGAVLTALPRPLMGSTVAIVAVTLVAGTLRSFDAIYARGPYRAIAQYLDRVATPMDPVSVYSLVGYAPVIDQFRQPHFLVGSILIWRHPGSGSTGYLVLDDAFARHLKIGARPQIQGFRLVSNRRFAGELPTAVLGYQAVGGH